MRIKVETGYFSLKNGESTPDGLKELDISFPTITDYKIELNEEYNQYYVNIDVLNLQDEDYIFITVNYKIDQKKFNTGSPNLIIPGD